MNAKRRKARRRKKTRITILSEAMTDPLRLYELSVQDAEATREIIETIYANHNDRPALTLREDFCGTAKLCAEWVSSDPQRTAVGLDIDVPTLTWARENNIAPLGDAAARVELIEKDVIEGTDGLFDIIVAFNFSYWIFHQRRELIEYFQAARNSLAPGGVFIVDLHGGPDSQRTLEEATEYDGFTYVWDQDYFNPITNRTRCFIHFRLPTGKKLERAFVYDWRVWSIPEVREILEEAGFAQVAPWWDGDDDVLTQTEDAENMISWIAYLAACG